PWNGATGAIARCKSRSTACAHKRRFVPAWRWICGVKLKLKAGNKPSPHSIRPGLDNPGDFTTVSRNLLIDSIRALKRGMMGLSDSQSDKPTTQQPLSITSPWAQFLTEMRTYFVSNVMTTAWSVLLFAGGMIFLVYFFSIGFMPELNP